MPVWTGYVRWRRIWVRREQPAFLIDPAQISQRNGGSQDDNNNLPQAIIDNGRKENVN